MTIPELLDGIHLPTGVWPTPSWRPENRTRLADEMKLVWLLEGESDPHWVREFVLPTGCEPLDGTALAGYTLDTHGDQVRAWLVSDQSMTAYRQLQASGAGTCPIEAVLPWTLHEGLPSLPAHLCGGQNPYHASPEALMQFWAMLAAGVWGEKVGLIVGLPELLASMV